MFPRTRVNAVHPRQQANNRRQIARQNTIGKNQGRGNASRSKAVTTQTQMPHQQNHTREVKDAKGPNQINA